MQLTGKNLIGNKLSGINPQSFKGHGGHSGIAFHEATVGEVDQAVNIAHRAFGSYKNTSGVERAIFLERIAQVIDENKGELVAIAMTESRLPEGRLMGETGRTTGQLKLFASLLREGSWVNAMIDPAIPDRQPLPKPDVRQMQRPLGPVAVFGASNFPFAFSTAGGDTASALAAGCPVVCKAHPGHPATSELVASLIIQAGNDTGMPEGVFSLVQGEGYEASVHLVSHPAIKAVGFTGSLGGGRALFNAAAKRNEPIPVYAEMGSVNPVFVLPEILEKEAPSLGQKLAGSNLMGAGQFCTNPGVIVAVRSKAQEQFTEAFKTALEAASADNMLTEKVFSGYCSNLGKMASLRGVTQLVGDLTAKEGVAAIPHMFQVEASAFINNPDLQEEVFGPSSLHVVADNAAQMQQVADILHGQLTASVWGTEKDMKGHSELIETLESKAGRVIFNAPPTGVEVTYAMVHGGPYPATTDSRSTSVGTNAIYRFTRAVCYQGYHQALLPEALQDANPLSITRKVNGQFTDKAL
jgi:2,5-dioxopentanoate dehydrogenase